MYSAEHPLFNLFVPFKLGKFSGFAYPVPALMALSEAPGGIDVFAQLTEDEQKQLQAKMEKQTLRETFEANVSLVWAGVLHECPTVTREEVAACFTLENSPEIMAAANEAFTRAMPKPKGEPARPLAESAPSA